VDDHTFGFVARGIAKTTLVCLVLAVAPPARAEVSLGVVDMQRALNECKAGKRAKEEVRRKFERAQKDLEAQRNEVDRLRADYEKKFLVVKEEERRNLEKNLERRSLDLKRRYEDFQRDLKRTDAELTAGIVEELYEVVNGYARERGFTVVLEASSGALVYMNSAVDITDEIIKRHDGR
jgi:outer membrane protein